MTVLTAYIYYYTIGILFVYQIKLLIAIFLITFFQGEIIYLQQALQNQEKSRDSLAQELSRIVNANQELVQRLEHLEKLKIDFDELKTKYDALLQVCILIIENIHKLYLSHVNLCMYFYRCTAKKLKRMKNSD